MMKKILFSLVLFIIYYHSQAQSENTAVDLAPSFFALIVQDMDQSLNWYQQHFGFQVDDVKVMEARGIKIANLSQGSTRLELIEFQDVINSNKAIEKLGSQTRVAGVFKIGFDVANFDNMVAEFRKAGVQFRGDVVEDPITGRNMVIVLDPDGNRIQLFESVN